MKISNERWACLSLWRKEGSYCHTCGCSYCTTITKYCRRQVRTINGAPCCPGLLLPLFKMFYTFLDLVLKKKLLVFLKSVWLTHNQWFLMSHLGFISSSQLWQDGTLIVNSCHRWGKRCLLMYSEPLKAESWGRTQTLAMRHPTSRYLVLHEDILKKNQLSVPLTLRKTINHPFSRPQTREPHLKKSVIFKNPNISLKELAFSMKVAT